jgi:hypothetical protein
MRYGASDMICRPPSGCGVRVPRQLCHVGNHRLHFSMPWFFSQLHFVRDRCSLVVEVK